MSIPGAYQTTTNGTHGNDVTAQFTIVAENVFAIDLPNGYDKSQTLRIDPQIYSTFVGGTGNDEALALGVTSTGSVVIAGSSSGFDYPTTPGTIERMNAGLSDCIISELDSTLSLLQFSTYLGGVFNDFSNGLTIDSQNCIYVTGSTESDNFPTTTNAYCRSHSGYRTDDCFVLKINPTGTQLVYSSFIGGSYVDEGYSIIANEADSSCSICGSTLSLDYPTTTGTYNPITNGGYDCIITKLSMNRSALLFSTYFGGSYDEVSNSIIQLRLDQSIVFAGYTNSSDFPCSSDAFDSSFHGGVDAFISRVSHDGSILMKSTYIGGSGGDRIHDIALSQDSIIIAVGVTASSDYPHTENAFDTTQNGNYDCFVTVINNNLSHLLYSSFFGGTDNDIGMAVARNSYEIIVTGTTSSTNFPTTMNALQQSYSGGSNDCFVVRISLDNPNHFYSTFLGGSSDDGGEDICCISISKICAIGLTSSANFPISSSCFDTSSNGQYDCFITQFTIDTTSVQESSLHPNSTLLVKNYPNPFNATTTLSYTLPSLSRVDLRLYDLTGREVSTLVQREQRAGSYRVRLDGSRLASGTYFVQLQAGAFAKTQKIVLLK